MNENKRMVNLAGLDEGMTRDVLRGSFWGDPKEISRMKHMTRVAIEDVGSMLWEIEKSIDAAGRNGNKELDQVAKLANKLIAAVNKIKE